MQINPVKVAPNMERLRRGGDVRFISFGAIDERRISP